MPSGLVSCASAILLLACSGCGLLPLPADVAGLVQGVTAPNGTQIVASVTTVNPTTQLPTQLSGVVTGEFSGDYQEEILDVFFDDNGAPLASLSRSIFTLTTPDAGTITSINLIVVVDFIFATDSTGGMVLDADGAPIVAGLKTASTGHIITGTGAFAGATGTLHTDSSLMFVGGDANLGTADSDLELSLDAGDVAGVSQ